MESEGGSIRGKSIREMAADINKNAVHRGNPMREDMSSPQRPSTAPPRSTMALSLPDRKEIGASSVFLSGGSLKLHPSTAPLRPVLGGDVSGLKPKNFGRLSLFDHDPHEILGPKVLRSYEPPKHGFAVRGSDDFLKKGDGRSLRGRNRLRELLKKHPVNREPAFQPGTAGLRLSWEATPSANSLFRYLYDNGTIDFVCVQSGSSQQNSILWGRQVRPGLMAWGDQPSEVEVAKWLPIFLEGIREYDEPYRFLASMGSEVMIREAGEQLHLLAADLVPPLKKALDTREPTVVAVAMELMHLILRLDKQVAKTWIYFLRQFSQVFNLFTSKGFSVNKGYNRRDISVIKDVIFEVLILLEENGGPDATALVRRFSRVGPAVTSDVVLRQTQKAVQKEGYEPWKPFTLF